MQTWKQHLGYGPAFLTISLLLPEPSPDAGEGGVTDTACWFTQGLSHQTVPQV